MKSTLILYLIGIALSLLVTFAGIIFYWWAGIRDWFRRYRYHRLQEDIIDMQTQVDRWIAAGEATCQKGGDVTGLFVDRIARMEGHVARLEARYRRYQHLWGYP
jgi:hypothetical protein